VTDASGTAHAKKILSFQDQTVDLLPLDILIGENTSGKSNLIEAISLLQAAPTDLRGAILPGGGIRFWLWLGDKVPSPIGRLACRVRYGSAASHVNYRLEITEDASGLVIVSESLSNDDATRTYFERHGQSVTFDNQKGEVAQTDSVLTRFKNPIDPTPTTKLGRQFEQVRIYREFLTGPRAQTRHGIASSVPKDYPSDGGDNLALILLEMDFFGLHERIRMYLNRFCERFDDVRVRLEGQVARAWLKEQGLLEPLPSVRLSDGTLKFLCLLAVLLHPDPPPLVCIEEPEQGLHPDAIQIVAQALVEASERMQLIVTTHSEALVDAFTDRPECVLVFDRDLDNGTRCRRFTRVQLHEWLERYTLGELWRKGEIGGNRW
jgi:predicted ATPase